MSSWRNMFQFLMGIIIGIFFSFIFLSVMLVANLKIDIGLITNIVIAFATMVAAIIHFDSVSKQRKDRIWEINKNVLLELAHHLSLVIKASEYYLEVEYESMSEYPEPPSIKKPEPDVYNKFIEKQEYVLEVYRSLMDKELIDSLEKAKEKHDEITSEINYDSCHVTEAYEESIACYKDLQTKLRYFMAKISGVKNM